MLIAFCGGKFALLGRNIKHPRWANRAYLEPNQARLGKASMLKGRWPASLGIALAAGCLSRGPGANKKPNTIIAHQQPDFPQLPFEITPLKSSISVFSVSPLPYFSVFGILIVPPSKSFSEVVRLALEA